MLGVFFPVREREGGREGWRCRRLTVVGGVRYWWVLLAMAVLAVAGSGEAK